MMPKKDKTESVEIGAAGAMLEAATLPVIALLQAEVEGLAALLPGMPLPEPAERALDADPFDNMPV